MSPTRSGQRIIAVVVRKPGTPEVTEAELVELVGGAELSAHKRPREVRFAETLPRNAMGKVQKRELL